jgi:hypothetical protein
MTRLGEGHYAVKEICILPSPEHSWGILNEKIWYPFSKYKSYDP